MPTRRDLLQTTLAGLALSHSFVSRAGVEAINNASFQHGELGFESATALAEHIRSKRISSLELTRYFIDRIERIDAKLNAVVVRDFERAEAAARLADKQLAAGRSMGALHGVPVTVKESFNVAGLPTTWGFKPWQGMRKEHDAYVVERLKSAGAVVMGKTNVPPMLGDYQSTNEIYGQTNNPWDTGRTPGGSSGGSAAALAAGLTGLEFGSDIGGSVRNPAHYCGVYGHKPTWNIVPMTGHAPPVAKIARQVDVAVVGPLARTAGDLRLAMDITAGTHALNQPGWTLTLPAARATSLRDLRVAFWPNEAGAPVTTEIEGRSRELMQALAKLGAKVSDTARPEVDMQRGMQAYLGLMQAVNSAGVGPEMYSQYEAAAAQFAADDFSNPALMARASIQSHNDWVNHDLQRTQIRYAWRRFFEDWDILICPIGNTTAFPHDHGPMQDRLVDVDGTQRPYFDGVFWAGLITLPGLPSTVFPTGPGQDGLPIGLQAVGAEFNDHTTLKFAELVQEIFGGFTPPNV